MTTLLAALGLVFLFIADYIGIVVWLLRTADVADQPTRFSTRGLFFAVTLVAIHLATFTAFLD